MERHFTYNQEDQNLSIWDKYFLGEGKASRKEFWCTFIVLIIMAFMVAFILNNYIRTTINRNVC